MTPVSLWPNMVAASKKILIVDDDEDLRELISHHLKQDSYQCYEAADGEEALELARVIRPDICLLDVTIPKIDGITLCNTLRTELHLNNTLILFLTARTEEYAQIAGFEAGGDDYIRKPVSMRLLKTRLHALERRYLHEAFSKLTVSDTIYIDPDARLVYKDGTSLELPKKEMDLLLFLTRHKGKVFSREDIYQRLWGKELKVGDRSVDVHVRKLREKLGNKTIRTIKGIGYKV